MFEASINTQKRDDQQDQLQQNNLEKDKEKLIASSIQPEPDQSVVENKPSSVAYAIGKMTTPGIISAPVKPPVRTFQEPISLDSETLWDKVKSELDLVIILLFVTGMLSCFTGIGALSGLGMTVVALSPLVGELSLETLAWIAVAAGPTLMFLASALAFPEVYKEQFVRLKEWLCDPKLAVSDSEVSLPSDPEIFLGPKYNTEVIGNYIGAPGPSSAVQQEELPSPTSGRRWP